MVPVLAPFAIAVVGAGMVGAAAGGMAAPSEPAFSWGASLSLAFDFEDQELRADATLSPGSP